MFHDEEEKKKRLTQWCKNVFNEMENGEIDEKKHANKTKLDLSRTNNE